MDTLDSPLSNDDIQRKVDCKFLPYDHLHLIKSINELLPKCLLLYQIWEGYGHFCCVFENEEGLNFFDPVGIKIDDELKVIDSQRRQQTYQDHPYLSKLFYDSGKRIIYNEYKLQHMGTATCGQFCAIRLKYSYLFNDEFRNAFKPYKGYQREIKAVQLFNQL